MSSNYFANLTRKARQLDQGIEKLSQIWEMPGNLIGGYHTATIDTETCVKSIWATLHTLQDEIDHFQSSEQSLPKSIEKTNELLHQYQDEYEKIKKEVNDLETVLSEYGYSYKEKDCEDLNIEYHVNGNQSDSSDQMEKSLVVFTPNLSWRNKKHSNGCNFTSSKSNQSYISCPKAIATPVIKSVGSVHRLQTLNEQNLDSPFVPFSSQRVSSMLNQKENISNNVLYPVKIQPLDDSDVPEF